MRIFKKLTICGMIILATTISVFAQHGQYSSRSLLEKTIYYVSNGKIGTTKFWALHLGSHDVKLAKKFPGEGIVPLNAQINFSLLSSGYIEGKGYSSRGKIDASANLGIITDDTVKEIQLDSIDYVTQNGRMVKPINGERTTLIIHTENDNRKVIRELLLREFYYDKAYDELKFKEDVKIQAFAFTKAGAQRALKALSASN